MDSLIIQCSSKNLNASCIENHLATKSYNPIFETSGIATGEEFSENLTSQHDFMRNLCGWKSNSLLIYGLL